ncbi:YjbH domain-containing protein [Aliiroseovarius sp. PTFE2010]|uniref:YjbH domain-containing protein n=1 Tax=Aliiroseovarius sp. PTFE2010 TaxID=3417190 RepID=UPI003CF1C207
MKNTTSRFLLAALALLFAAGALTNQARAQDRTLSFFGTPGIVEMPTADPFPDGHISLSVAHFAKTTHSTFSFQITHRLGGSFRYTAARDFNLRAGRPSTDYYDRSFDLYYQLAFETAWRPNLRVGIRDFGGTGIYASEYIVATKRIAQNVRLSFGIGWGRLGTHNGFTNPIPGFSERAVSGGTGEFKLGTLFHGDAAIFGGVDWAATDRFHLLAEYSSDAYTREVEGGLFERQNPVNFGVSYQFDSGLALGVYYLYGSQLGIRLSYGFNPKSPPIPGGIDEAPPELLPRSAIAAASWGDVDGKRFANDLADQGLQLGGISLHQGRAIARINNARFGSGAQAIGRAARILANTLPADIEFFTIIPTSNSMALSAVTLKRSDLESYEHQPGGSWQTYVRAHISDAYVLGSHVGPLSPDQRFNFRVGAYLSPTLFDPDSPLRFDAGVEIAASYQLSPAWVVHGALRQPLLGNRDGAEPEPDGTLHHVRSDAVLYDRAADLELSYLVAEHFFRPATNTYARVSFGYLERMFGGVSGEILWKPVDNRLAFGLEVNYARQRNFDLGFGFQDYDVVTGHASAYYDFKNGFLAQIDMGRYLAGDWGATFSLDREFNNGVRIGAFFTLTDVPFDEFGEGAFDKGIRISLPLSWLSGRPSQQGFGTVIRPVTRDGGARLDVANRLYEITRGYHRPVLERQWGRFWR